MTSVRGTRGSLTQRAYPRDTLNEAAVRWCDLLISQPNGLCSSLMNGCSALVWIEVAEPPPAHDLLDDERDDDHVETCTVHDHHLHRRVLPAGDIRIVHDGHHEPETQHQLQHELQLEHQLLLSRLGTNTAQDFLKKSSRAIIAL